MEDAYRGREKAACPSLSQKELQDAIEDRFAKSITLASPLGLRRVQGRHLDSAHKKMTELRESKPGLVDAIDEVSFYVEFGPVKATYASFYSNDPKGCPTYFHSRPTSSAPASSGSSAQRFPRPSTSV